jgi:phospholipid/cholesterol/gamma-HCH transport system ATP-binding protein
MRRRVSIARTLATRPPIVLYDSPTAGLDPVTAQTIITLILQLRDVFGVTAIMATHRLQDGFGLARFRFDPESKRVVRLGSNEGSAAAARAEDDEPATRFMVYRDGRVYFEGKPEELAESKDAYLQKFLV